MTSQTLFSNNKTLRTNFHNSTLNWKSQYRLGWSELKKYFSEVSEAARGTLQPVNNIILYIYIYIYIYFQQQDFCEIIEETPHSHLACLIWPNDRIYLQTASQGRLFKKVY